LREIDHHLELLLFSNDYANCGCLLTKLLAYCPLYPSLEQVYNFIPDVLTQLSGLGHCDEVEVLFD